MAVVRLFARMFATTRVLPDADGVGFSRSLFFHFQLDHRDADLIAARRAFIAIVIRRVRRFEILHFIETFRTFHANLFLRA
jgi:hypothetical protein